MTSTTRTNIEQVASRNEIKNMSAHKSFYLQQVIDDEIKLSLNNQDQRTHTCHSTFAINQTRHVIAFCCWKFSRKSQTVLAKRLITMMIKLKDWFSCDERERRKVEYQSMWSWCRDEVNEFEWIEKELRMHKDSFLLWDYFMKLLLWDFDFTVLCEQRLSSLSRVSKIKRFLFHIRLIDWNSEYIFVREY